MHHRKYTQKLLQRAQNDQNPTLTGKIDRKLIKKGPKRTTKKAPRRKILTKAHVLARKQHGAKRY